MHRLVVDESHLLAEAAMGTKLTSLLRIRAHHVWLVSGTPFSTSLEQLRRQTQLLGASAASNFATEVNSVYKSNEDVGRARGTRGVRSGLGMPCGTGGAGLAAAQAWRRHASAYRSRWGRRAPEAPTGTGGQLRPRARAAAGGCVAARADDPAHEIATHRR